MKHTFWSLILVAALSLAACSETFDSTGNKQMIGAGTGAILGGLVGSKVGKGSGQLVGVGVGTLLGLMAGSEIGKSLDKADMAYAQQAEAKAYHAPIGQSISWNNPESGNYGTITPVRDGRSNDGRYCREYKQAVFIDGKAETVTGRACENRDGTWEAQQ